MKTNEKILQQDNAPPTATRLPLASAAQPPAGMLNLAISGTRSKDVHAETLLKNSLATQMITTGKFFMFKTYCIPLFDYRYDTVAKA